MLCLGNVDWKTKGVHCLFKAIKGWFSREKRKYYEVYEGKMEKDRREWTEKEAKGKGSSAGFPNNSQKNKTELSSKN